jgi:hypothetical protein
VALRPRRSAADRLRDCLDIETSDWLY